MQKSFPGESSNNRVVIMGGSGFLGMNLARSLSGHGYEVTIVSRSEPAVGPWSFAQWDGRTLDDWASVIDGAHAVVNLAGRTVDCIKSPLNCDQILRSRVESTRVLGDAIIAAKVKPNVWVQMSTAHIYGDSELQCDEQAAIGYGLAPTVGIQWERAHNEKCSQDVRSVILRTSFVLGNTGAALQKLKLITRLGLGGTIASGTQGMSWIHELDMNRIIERAITDGSMTGVYISSSPSPVSNRVFMRSLRKACNMPIGLPTAAWMIKIGARLILRTDPDLAIYGRYCVPQRLIDEGFEFAHPEIDEALDDLCRNGSGAG